MPSPTCQLGQGGIRENGMWPEGQLFEPSSLRDLLVLRQGEKRARANHDNSAHEERGA